MSFILITHDIATSSELADRVAVMYAGQIMEVGHAHHYPYACALLAAWANSMISHPVRLLLFGFVALLAGCMLPFLMVIRLIEPSLLLRFLSFTLAVTGLFLGFIGTTMDVSLHRSV